ncbi:Cys/Met metabolism PLP-dependent enzyme-domain-containing protein [Radiomyces spectabilis]|uniref:Cys/Met metabolism PLP-dependent enzyme-domain-containing protein n=1 Tax=Radiomyces spectabilis TaxID=64574 RepID=UPI0022200595|nr:Cys/Met metabolism PLP-dependent enzyme-domain-containing protein [Radiomyces spectabilis]KAI8381113.1 Cys/Met metabolism PLP-dependent enzyme-domain-containing protein [Radiomyces spectabilis]
MSPSDSQTTGFGTRAIHAGQNPDPITGAVIPPVSLSTTFKQSAAGVHTGYEYSRSGNPTRENFETAVAALEGGKYGVAFASGSSVTATIINTLHSGGHLISVNDVYGGTYRYFTKVAVHNGVDATFVNLSNAANIKDKFKPNTKLVWLESPTNPTLRIIDIRAVAEYAHQNGAILVVDNTFMSPYFQNPLALGADIVVHSVTKYINGHSDVVMGVAVTNDKALYEKLTFMQNSMGAVPSAFDSFLARRGLMTLEIRMQRHEQNAKAIAEFLQKNEHVEEVIYPGLPSHPEHELAKRQQRGFGGMISFRVKGTLDNVNKMLGNLQHITLAESLGGVESLVEVPAVMTHAAVSAEDRAALGITDTLVRFSVGIENVEDLVQDLQQALDKAY